MKSWFSLLYRQCNFPAGKQIIFLTLLTPFANFDTCESTCLFIRHRIYFVYQSHLAVCISSILQMPMQCIHFIVALDICKGKSHKCHRRRHLFRLLRITLLQYCSRWCSLYNLDVQLNCSHISYKNTCRVTGTTQNIVSWSSQIDTCCMAYLSKILNT